MNHGDPGPTKLWRTMAAALLALVAAAAARAGDVDVALVRMGVGSHVRPGDPTAILVRLTSALTEPVQARVQWVVRNADGDNAQYSRDIALAPGAPVDRWIYGVMPITEASAQGSLRLVTLVRVLQVEDGRVRRLLAEQRIDAESAQENPTPVESNEALIGVLGDGRAGLSAYATPSPKSNEIASMNELTRIARGIDAGALPDRWEGLFSFESMIWTNASVQNLAPEQARALLDWTRRGGNLVIVAPESGDPWGLAGQRGRTALGEVLPKHATRHEGVLVSTLLPILSKTRDLRNPAARTGLWTFEAPGDDGYQPLIVLPARVDARSGNLVTNPETLEGAVVAVRRPLGLGFVTVLGIDADGLDRRSLAADGLPQADIFWNRILGRRADTPGQLEQTALEAANKLNTKSVRTLAADGGELVNRLVGMRSEAAFGVLALVGAFGIYWVVAGPGSYFALRASKRTQYAWTAFLAVAVAATAIVWTASGIAELKSARVQHVSFVDRVEGYGRPAEERRQIRVNSWLSAALPGYGGAKVALAPGEGAPGADAIWTFFPPPAGNMSGFPDVETYEVPSSNPASYEMPSRATATVLATTWMGAAPTEWDGLPRELREQPLRQEVVWGESTAIILRGKVEHSLAVPLRDVQLIYVNPFRPPPRRYTRAKPPLIEPSAAMPSYARIVSVGDWAPGSPLDVAESLFGSGSKSTQGTTPRENLVYGLSEDLRRRFQERAQQQLNMYYSWNGSAQALYSDEDLLWMRLFFAMMPPPDYILTGQQSNFPGREETVRFQRDFGRQLDMSPWLSQPCLIVIGRVSSGEGGKLGLPMPFTIDGATPASDGQTWVRVVFPLPEVLGAMVPPVPTAQELAAPAPELGVAPTPDDSKKPDAPGDDGSGN